jgi:hypothetical protein
LANNKLATLRGEEKCPARDDAGLRFGGTSRHEVRPDPHIETGKRRAGSHVPPVGTFAAAARLDSQEDRPMTISIIVGGWLAFNVLFVVVLLFRRDRPAVDCRFENASGDPLSAHRPPSIRDRRSKMHAISVV